MIRIDEGARRPGIVGPYVSTSAHPSPAGGADPVRQEVAFLVAKPEAHFVLQMAFPGPAPRVSVTNPQSHFLPYRVEMAVDFRFGLDFALSVAIRGWTTTQ